LAEFLPAGFYAACTRKPFLSLTWNSAPYASSVSEQLHLLGKVLKAADYGFIGDRLKELILNARNQGAQSYSTAKD
jgi:hypothetical protein